MTLNRALRPPINRQEFLLYGFLCRHYTAEMKRGDIAPSSPMAGRSRMR